MNKKISELELLDPGEDGYIPVVETSTGETKKISIADVLAPVGTVIHSMLSSEQFNAITFGTWMLMNGQSCAGTSYATLTGNTNVPNAFTDGRFLRQAGSGVTLGFYQDDDFKSHTHVQNSHNHIDGFAGVNTAASYGVTSAPAGNINSQSGQNTANHPYTSSTTAVNQNTGGTETRPKNISVNFFIRVN